MNPSFRIILLIILVAMPIPLLLVLAQGNNPPEITNVWVNHSIAQESNSTITPANDGLTRTFYISGTAVDIDGCTQIDSITANSWVAKFYDSATQTNGCGQDDDDCYVPSLQDVDITDCTGGEDTDLRFDFDGQLNYFAQPGSTWYGYVSVQDDAGAPANASSNAITVSTTRDLDAAETISFGTIAIEGVATTNFTIANVGNTSMDLLFRSLDATINCTSPTSNDIPLANVAYSTNSIAAPEEGVALTASNQNFNISLPRRTSQGQSITNIYAAFRMPKAINGTCENIVQFTAATDE